MTGGRETATTTGVEKTFAYDRITETLTDRAVRWIEANHDEPFLVYFAHTAVHRPVAPNPTYKGKSKYGIYGDFIEELDRSVGTVLDALDRLGLADDTLVIVTSDNGGVVANTAEHAETQKAGLNINGPLRDGKHSIYEGGFREPFLVRWPGHVPAGTVSDAVICLTDVPATVAGILDVPLKPGQAEDSFDVREAFVGNPTGPVRGPVVLQDARDLRGPGRELEADRAGRDAGGRAAEQEGGQPEREGIRPRRTVRRGRRPGCAADVHAAHPDVVTRLRQALTDARSSDHTRPDPE